MNFPARIHLSMIILVFLELQAQTLLIIPIIINFTYLKNIFRLLKNVFKMIFNLIAMKIFK